MPRPMGGIGGGGEGGEGDGEGGFIFGDAVMVCVGGYGGFGVVGLGYSRAAGMSIGSPKA